jgi:hypothetical protein
MSRNLRSPMAAGVQLAASSAITFGITTPLIGALGSNVGPLTVAALLYAGAAALSIALRLRAFALVSRIGRG